MFKIFKDKEKIFKCTVDVQGANINDCYARLIFETSDTIVMHKGKIDASGGCKIPIPKVKIFEEGVTGKVTLEVIAENTLFESWNSDFQVAVEKKISVVLEEEMIDQEPVITKKNVNVVIFEDEEIHNVSETKTKPEYKSNNTSNNKKAQTNDNSDTHQEIPDFKHFLNKR